MSSVAESLKGLRSLAKGIPAETRNRLSGKRWASAEHVGDCHNHRIVEHYRIIVYTYGAFPIRKRSKRWLRSFLLYRLHYLINRISEEAVAVRGMMKGHSL